MPLASRPSILLVAMLLGPGSSMRAQLPADRAVLETFREQLARADTPEEVRGLMAMAPASLGGSTRELRRAFGLIRLGELTGDRTALDEAVLRLDAVQARRSTWVYPWFGLALAKMALHGQDALVKSSRNQVEGVSYLEGYTQAFARMFARDSSFEPAIAMLRRMMLAQGERDQPGMLLAAIRRVGLSDRGTADDAMILARDYRHHGQGDSALVALDLYRERGGDSGISYLEEARTLASLDSPYAARDKYLEGLRHLSVGSRSAYRADLAWIAEPDEMLAFDRVGDDSLASWVQDFWRWRDVHELRAEGERLLDHLRRWAFVDSHYRVQNPERRTQFSRTWITPGGPCNRGDFYLADDILGDSVVRPHDGRHRERLYDDRAYVYMRHGEPAKRVTGKSAWEAPSPSLSSPTVRGDDAATPGRLISDDLRDERMDHARANESWLYWFGGERRVFNFEGSVMLGLAAPTTLAVEPLQDGQWLESRGQLDPVYWRMAHLREPGSMPFSCRQYVREAAFKARADARVALTSDSYTLPFDHELVPVVQMYALGRPDLGTGRILVVFALPGQQLEPRPLAEGDPPGVWYPVDVRIGATDSLSRVYRSLDTTRQFLARDTLRAGSHLTGLLEVPLAAGLYRVGAAFSQPDVGIGGSKARDGLDLRTAGRGLYLSDLVLGRDGSGLSWHYRGEDIPLNPLGAFPKSETARMFYELSGLTSGRSYVTSVELAPLKAKDKKAAVRFQFTTVAEGEHTRVHRSLGLGQLAKGQYRLIVEVAEEGTARRVQREQYLTILE